MRINRSLYRIIGSILFLTLSLASPAFGQVIDLFDNQEAMAIETIDGTSAASGDDEGAVAHARRGRIDGSMRVPFHRERGTIFVELKIQGQPQLFVLDTGASGTTLTSSVARSLGILPGAQSPRLLMQTAGGVTETRVGIIGHLEIGNQTLTKVSYVICDPCGAIQYRGRPVAGLLGMNILRRYRMSLDDSTGVLELVQNMDFSNQWSDIEPFMTVQYLGHGYSGSSKPQMVVRLNLMNRSPHTVRDISVELTCRSETGEVKSSRERVKSVPANRSVEVDIRGTVSDCHDVQPEIVEARW
ncbi:MAG: TIGR02281 family clan AA aspartic protease [Bradymonadaceae bacterium]